MGQKLLVAATVRKQYEIFFLTFGNAHGTFDNVVRKQDCGVADESQDYVILKNLGI